jgi:hypothetical protein
MYRTWRRKSRTRGWKRAESSRQSRMQSRSPIAANARIGVSLKTATERTASTTAPWSAARARSSPAGAVRAGCRKRWIAR